MAVCCCKRFAQLVEQARVLDGDDGLGGEIFDQLDLLVGERPYLLAIDAEAANQFVLLQHRNEKQGPSAGEFGKRNRCWLALDICLVMSHIGNMLQFVRRG